MNSYIAVYQALPCIFTKNWTNQKVAGRFSNYGVSRKLLNAGITRVPGYTPF